MNNNFYNKNLKPFANSNRKNMTKSEACMWKYVLSKGQMKGYQFRQQRPIDSYIVDFVCLPLKLVIEVDGFTHENEFNYSKDKKRDFNLEQLGFTTLRFSSWEVLNRIDDVSIIIAEWIENNAQNPPPPWLPPAGEINQSIPQ
ncbi:endonuclease domain-containing protein [Membranihabitans maritimus]|uniref:endonuclease domain-containing protein n=1 Tax=Membranihabitans maritimus TaxID=2904244 RepID=UPI001F168258|nr:endonuclease domain-containing protein [Membranihabitans maritimus]